MLRPFGEIANSLTLKLGMAGALLPICDQCGEQVSMVREGFFSDGPLLCDHCLADVFEKTSDDEGDESFV